MTHQCLDGYGKRHKEEIRTNKKLFADISDLILIENQHRVLAFRNLEKIYKWGFILKEAALL